MGSKNHLYPYENDLITEEKWVSLIEYYHVATLRKHARLTDFFSACFLHHLFVERRLLSILRIV